MRLIEKSLTESVYSVLNESSDQDKAAKRLARYKKSNRVRVNESDKYYVSFSSGELNMDVPFNNDKIKRDIIKGKGGKGPDGVETDLVRYIGTKEDLEKLMDKDFDGEYKNNIKKLDESEEAQLNDLYNASKVEWDDLSGSDQTAVEYFSSNFGDNIADKSWDEVESDIIEACYEIGYANEELINNGYWNDGDMDPEPDEKKVTDYIFQNYFLPKKNSKNMNESAETDKMTLKDYAMKFYEGDIDIDVTDTEIGMMVAFVYDFNEEPKDNYDRFLNLLGERTKVVKVGNNVLTCDFSSVFKPYEDKLQDFFNMDYSDFNEAYYEAVYNLEPLISGNAGEKTYKELIDILNGKQINESVDTDSIIRTFNRDSRKFADMVMELRSYVEAEPSKILRDLKAAIKSNKLEDYLKHSAAMDDEELSNFIKKYSGESMNESFDVNKVAKRIARYKEPDKHIFHSWYEKLSPDKAEEMARQASLENPEDVYFVQYDDIMNGSSEYRYVNGVQYNINKGGFHWTNGLPKFHTDADWQAVYNGEKTWEEIDAMNESVDNDPDLDADQVQADVDYWTDVDEANTEDVTDMKPIGVYTVSNNSAIYVYQIEYDIEDRVLAGDSSDETKAKWRYIIYGDGEAYFWYGDIKVPFNDVMKTDM